MLKRLIKWLIKPIVIVSELFETTPSEVDYKSATEDWVRLSKKVKNCS